MAERLAEIKTPLGNKLLLRGLHGHEELGRPFEYQIELLSEDDSIQPADVVGQEMTVKLALETQGQYRYVNGVTTRFTDAGRVGRYALYRAELRPYFWLLSQTSDCRIFQNEAIPDILKTLLRDHGFSDIEDRLTGTYDPLKYVVQYRESALNFITRLMERSGIYYYFTHADGTHTLVLADGSAAHQPAPGYEEVPYYPPSHNHPRERDHLYEWRMNKRFSASAFTVDSFDYKRPSADLSHRASDPRDHAKADFEFYDYQGSFFEASDAEKQSKLHLLAHHAKHEQMYAEGIARGLSAGHRFTLTGAKRPDANREYLVVSLETALEINDYESGTGALRGGTSYRCKLGTIDAKTEFKLPITTPKPKILGAQTAIVAGRKGEDIWTDEHGRIKVEFHWDRSDRSGESRSCWVRVAQLWAGSGFGGLYIPRVGQEVVVTFVDGDPDRPLVIGGVYNGDNKPPYALPGNASQSGIKTRSTREGAPDEANEIRFEDKKGEEELFVHAQRDARTVVERDAHAEIKRDQHLTISGSQVVRVAGGHAASGVTGAKLDITGTYDLATTQSVEISGPVSITIKCGESSAIQLEPQMITLKVGGAALVVTPAGVVMSPAAAVGKRSL